MDRTARRAAGVSAPTLQGTLVVAVAAVALLAVVAAVCLLVLTTYLHGTAQTLADELASVRLVQQMQIGLIAHARARDAGRREAFAAVLRRQLVQAKIYVDDPGEAMRLAHATRDVQRYLRRAQGATRDAEGRVTIALEAASRALDRVVEENVLDARAAEARASRWNRRANGVGVALAAVLVLGVGGAVVWLRGFAFRPVFRIREAMRAFAGGDTASRAPEEGPAELCGIAHQFNDMADTLARHRQEQLSFLAGVAHDLRTPLTALRMSTDLLSEGGSVPSADRLRTSLAIVRRQIGVLERMITDLLDASRIEAGRLDLCEDTNDACAVARHVHELFRDASPAHEVVLRLPQEPVAMRFDAMRIEQVLNNLVSNAVKYSPEGGRVEIAVECEDHAVVFRVSDEGIGIAPEDLVHVFEPFRRVRVGAGGARVPGVGLGLSVARRIVTAHGGDIEVDSRPGAGSTFRARLPRGTDA